MGRTFIISDPHGEYSLFLELMNKIGFSEKDKLYICGDVIEKGPDSIKLLSLVASMPNAYMIRGNHEEAFLNYYLSLMQESEDYGGILEKLREYIQGDGSLLSWELMDYLEALPYYIETEDFICVHAGLPLNEKGEILSPELVPANDILYNRRFKNPQVLPTNSKCVFFGHTSSMTVGGEAEIIEYYIGEEKPSNIKDYIKVHLDTGVFSSGVLGCFCVDDCSTYYVRKR